MSDQRTWSTGTPRANRKRPQFQTTIDAEVERRLKSYCKKLNVSMADVTTVALDEYLRRWKS